MKAREKYIKVFGKIDSLDEKVSWTTGVSNLLEWLSWSTQNILGITKTQLIKKIVLLSSEKPDGEENAIETYKRVKSALDAEQVMSERLNRYDRPENTLATAREVLRRTKYFSEDYLNKEFDIFMCLSSDKYLNSFYSQFTSLQGVGTWCTHGNSGLFEYSTAIKVMCMDNLSYNREEKLLIANELKLGGKKNPDQILKYALMHSLLIEGGFVAFDTKLLLLFIGHAEEAGNWEEMIEEEIRHCGKSTKSTAGLASDPAIIDIAKSAKYASTTWDDLLTFNRSYISSLNQESQQVEYKLIFGFNQALATKAFMKANRPQA